MTFLFCWLICASMSYTILMTLNPFLFELNDLPNTSACKFHVAWRRHQMKAFSLLVVICAGNLPVTGEFPAQRPVTQSFDLLFDLRLNKRLSKQSWGWWFETLSRPLWRHCNGQYMIHWWLQPTAVTCLLQHVTLPPCKKHWYPRVTH